MSPNLYFIASINYFYLFLVSICVVSKASFQDLNLFLELEVSCVHLDLEYFRSVSCFCFFYLLSFAAMPRFRLGTILNFQDLKLLLH